MSENLKPTYLPNSELLSGSGVTFDRLLNEVPWLQVAETRQEYFMSETPLSYTYGKGRGVRTYESAPFLAGVDTTMGAVNKILEGLSWGPVNVCFLNRYDSEQMHLGWHADDHEGTDHKRPIVVISFGEAREIWWRKNEEKGEIPAEQRQLLGDGSMFIMLPGFQFTHQHRIPKGGRQMGTRISLTYRAFKGI